MPGPRRCAPRVEPGVEPLVPRAPTVRARVRGAAHVPPATPAAPCARRRGGAGSAGARARPGAPGAHTRCSVDGGSGHTARARPSRLHTAAARPDARGSDRRSRSPQARGDPCRGASSQGHLDGPQETPARGDTHPHPTPRRVSPEDGWPRSCSPSSCGGCVKGARGCRNERKFIRGRRGLFGRTENEWRVG